MAEASSSPPAEETKKRKRSSVPADELEINVDAPEPPSKKALRRAKKGKTGSAPKSSTNLDEAFDPADTPTTSTTPADSKPTTNDSNDNDPTAKRSAHGIWIGNLPFSADRAMLRTFLSTHGAITETEITRVHMPTPNNDPKRTFNKPQNKGFAYVDFSSAEVLERALKVSETLMAGRRVLIKDAKSFVGRPEKSAATDGATDAKGVVGGGRVNGAATTAKAKSKRVFVGNLGFDVTKDDLERHFGQAGEVEDVHVATFEDTGKCKGFAWVRFVEVDSAEAAVRGFVFKDEGQDDEEDEEEAKVEDDNDDSDEEQDLENDEDDSKLKKSKKAKKQKKNKKRKWFINRLLGRPLGCEFAEDASVRYKKRFGKAANTEADGRPRAEAGGGNPVDGDTEEGVPQKRQRLKGDKEQRQEQRRQKHVDARSIRPGAALANAPRASGAIVEGTGKKTTFDD